MQDAPAETVSEPFGARLRRHVGDLLRLAWPVMLSRAGMLVMAFVDIIMLGRYSAEAIGAFNLGVSIFVPLMVFTIGLTSGSVPVISRAFGAGDWAECGRAWRRAVSWALMGSGFAALICWQGETWLSLFGQTEELAAKGGAVTRVLAPGLVAQVFYAACAFYLESTRRPLAALVAMIFANLGNIALNWLLIWGHWGLPEMGAAGAALATTAMRFAMAATLLAVILGQRDPRGAGVVGPWESLWGPGGWRAGAMMRRLGLSAGISTGFETIGFAAMTMFAGQLGTLPLAAYSLSHNLTAMVFMIGLGLSIATGVRVGIEIGRGRPDEAAFAGWTGLATVAAIMALIGLVVFMGRGAIVTVYTDDPVVAARAAGLFALAALIFLPDGAQVVLGQAVRALGDAWVAVACYIGAFIVLMLPMGWALVNVLGYDERALILTIVAACWLATALLGLRFRVLTRRMVRRIGG